MAKSASSKRGGEDVTAAVRFAIFHGPERFLQDAYTQKLREALVEAEGGGEDAVQTVRFDGAAAGAGGGGIIADILDECRSMGLMAPRKLVIVDNADVLLKSADDDEGASKPAPAGKRGGPRHKTSRELMESYAADPSDAAALVLRADTWRPGKLDKAVAELGERGAVIKCEPLTPAEATKWAVARCAKRHGTTLTPDAAALLVENIGAELGRIDAELGKLAMVEPGKPISVEMVRQFVGVSREEEFWKIQRTVLTGNPAAALSHLREMIDVSRHDPVPLGWAFTDLARKLHGLSRGIAQGENPQGLLRALRIWGAPQEVEQVLRIARKLKPRQAAGLLRAAIETDTKLKSSNGDPVTNLEALAIRFTSEIG